MQFISQKPLGEGVYISTQRRSPYVLGYLCNTKFGEDNQAPCA